jgi:DNA-directed RNA polymerase subunit E'/Rpb7
LQPSTFSQPTDQALISVLNKKYANRVLHDVGLCVCVFDLLELSDGRVRYGDGCLWHKGVSPAKRDFTSQHNAPVLFRLVVFRPFISEVIFGKVKSSSEDGIRGSSSGSESSLFDAKDSHSWFLRRHPHPSHILTHTLCIVSSVYALRLIQC